MKLLKPAWVTQDGNPIFSIDIHPDGSRFATGGQGDDSGRVIIWNMAPVINEEDEKDENVPKMLCQMDNHLACVNCVRWSLSGHLLASGGDDKIIMIWKIGGAGGGGNIEQWRCLATLRGHSGDVLDLAWSPHSAWLASCSVDNTVIIWNALKLPEMVAVLKGHTGLVKGVSWDPVGKYVATQSDDKSLGIWRTVDWQMETCITEPFEECGGTTHVLRLSWSPDGQYLVSAHAMNGGGPTAQIIEREGWRTDKDFVGHRKAITCVRFNSNMLQKLNKETKKVQQYCCCAIGSRDRSLSIWLTALRRPLVVIHELFTSSVLDLSWSSSGMQLMACSQDGTIACVEFSEDELGKPLSLEEKNALHQRMYGKSISMPGSANLLSATLIENPELLRLKEKVEKDRHMPPSELSRESSKSTPQAVLLKGPINKQIEMRTADGKRRITPMYIPPAPDVGDGPQPFRASGAPQVTFSSSTETKSKIMIEKRDDVVQPNVSSLQTPPKSGISNGDSTSRSALMSSAAVSVGVSDANRSLSKGPTEDGAFVVQKVTKDRFHRVSTLPVKRKLDRELPRPAKRGRPPLSDKPQLSTPQPQIGEVRREKSPPKMRLSGESTLHLSALRLGAKTASIQVPGTARFVEVENNIVPTAFGAAHRVRAGGTGANPWQLVFGSPVCGVVANLRMTAIACNDGTLHMVDNSGRRLFPPVALGSAPARLSINDTYLMAVTSHGAVFVWDLNKKCVNIRNESLVPIMNSETGSTVSITGCTLTKKGLPIISVSTGKSYTYSADMGTWLLLANADVVHRASNHSRLVQCVDSDSSLSQAQGRGPGMVAGQLLGNPLSNPSCTLTQLENQLVASVALGVPNDYRRWTLALARFLSQEGLEWRLRLLCEDLLGPAHSGALKSKTWEAQIMGLDKRKLLEEVLCVVGSNLKLQRLYTEYKDQLTLVQQPDNL